MTTEDLERLAGQQSTLAKFGQEVGSGHSLDDLLTNAARMAASSLGVEYVKVLEWQPDRENLLVRAGFGWSEGVIGYATVGADLESPSGFALKTGKPVISNDLESEDRFRVPQLLANHNVRSAVNVIIRGREIVFGVLEADSREPRTFTEEDTRFLQGAANLLGLAIDRQRLSDGNAELARQKDVLLKELQHRVKNNAQTLLSLINLHLAKVQFGESHEALRALRSRVEALSLLDTQLFAEAEMERVDLGRYLMELLGNLVKFHGEHGATVRLDTSIASVIVRPDTAKDVGMLTSEFVMNSFKHAYSAGEGVLFASLEREGERATLVLADNGPGLPESPAANGLGLRLMRALAERIGGILKLENRDGARLTLSFPVD